MEHHMPQVELIATKQHVYGGKSRKVGDQSYMATRQDADALIALGRAKRAPKPDATDDAKAATYTEQRIQPKDMIAETDDDDAPKAKRKYVRRDLEAE